MNNVKAIRRLNETEINLGIKEGASWHKRYKESAYIFIGGLDYDLTEGDIIAVFSQYGEIININLVRDKKGGKSKGYCFLAYEDQRSTTLAVDNLNGIKLCDRTLRVDHVRQYRRPKDENGEEIIEKGCAPKTPSPSPEPPTKQKKKKKKKDASKSHKEKKSDKLYTKVQSHSMVSSKQHFSEQGIQEVVRSKSPQRRRSKSPQRRRSRSPQRRRSKSPQRRRSKSPQRRRSRSPQRRRSKSPQGRRSKSPQGRRSKSPQGRRSRSPRRRKSRSPQRRRSKSPQRRRSKSPQGRRSKSPQRRRSRSPRRRKSKSPPRRRSRSPR